MACLQVATLQFVQASQSFPTADAGTDIDDNTDNVDTMDSPAPEDQPRSFDDFFDQLCQDYQHNGAQFLVLLQQQAALDQVDDELVLQLLASKPNSTPEENLHHAQQVALFTAAAVVKHVTNALRVAGDLLLSPEEVRSKAEWTAAVVHTHVERAQTLLSSIASPCLRLETCEMVFSLLFASDVDLMTMTDDDNFDRHKEPQLVATQMLVDDLATLLDLELQRLQTRRSLDADVLSTGLSVTADNFSARLEVLSGYVTEAVWRVDLLRTGGRRSPSELSLIVQLLAPPEALLATCIREQRFDEALKVMSMYEIESKAAQDAKFGQRLSDLSARLAKGIAYARLWRELLTDLSPMQAARVSLDLGATAAMTRDSSQALLEEGIKLLQTDSTDDKHAANLLPLLLELQKVFVRGSSSLSDVLLKHPYPLDSAADQSAKQLLEERHATVEDLSALFARAPSEVDAETQSLRDYDLVSMNGAAGDTNFRTTLDATVRLFDAQAPPREILRFIPLFLQQLQSLRSLDAEEDQRLLAALLQTSPTGWLAQQALGEEPTAIAQSAAVAQAVGLELEHVIQRATCLPVRMPRTRSLTSANRGMFGSARQSLFTKREVVVLNDVVPTTVAAAAAKRNSRPLSADFDFTSASNLSHDLLVQLMSLLEPFLGSQGFDHILLFHHDVRTELMLTDAYRRFQDGTLLLAETDFALLSDVERECALANVLNLLRLHACIAQGPSAGAVDRTAWSSKHGYRLGSLGVVTLRELDHALLQTPQSSAAVVHRLLQPLRSELKISKPSAGLVFALWQGPVLSPSPTPLQPVTITASLQNARTAYLLRNVVAKPATGDVLLPLFLRNHAGLLDLPLGFDLNKGLSKLTVAQQVELDKALLVYTCQHLPAGSRQNSSLQSIEQPTIRFQRQLNVMGVCWIGSGPVDPREFRYIELRLKPVLALFAPSHTISTLTDQARKHFLQHDDDTASLTFLLQQQPMEEAFVALAEQDPIAAFQAQIQTYVKKDVLHRWVELRLQKLCLVKSAFEPPFTYQHLLALVLHPSSDPREFVSHRLADKLLQGHQFELLVELITDGALQCEGDNDWLLLSGAMACPDMNLKASLLL
jgi:hypothetical protein